MSCRDTIRVRRSDGSEEEIPIEDFFKPFLPPEDPDPPPDFDGGDSDAIEHLVVGAIFGSAPADGESEIEIIARVMDSNFLGVEGQTVEVQFANGLTITGGDLTDGFGETSFFATSNAVGDFVPRFRHVDTNAAEAEVSFVDPDDFEEPRDPVFGQDFTDEEIIAQVRALSIEVRAKLNAIVPSQHPIITSQRVSKVLARLDSVDHQLDKYDADDTIVSGSWDGQKTYNAIANLGAGRVKWLTDATYDAGPIDSDIEEMAELIAKAFLKDSAFSAETTGLGPRLDDGLGSGDDPAEWKETERTTSTITIEGVEIERIDTVTFDVPGNGLVKLVLNHPDE